MNPFIFGKKPFSIKCMFVFLFLLLVVMNNSPLYAGPEFLNDLKIHSTEVNYSEKNECANISCIGKIQNLSEHTYEYLVLEIQYFNSENKLIDTATDQLYSHIVPPKDEIAFRIIERADKESDQYVSHKIKITSAKIQYNEDNYYPHQDTYNEKENDDWLFEVIVSWIPMIILISFWVFFMYRYTNSKKSPQKQTLVVLQEQVKQGEKHNSIMEKLVETIENVAQNKK